MCMFAGTSENNPIAVSSTRIFARIEKERQCIVYEMKISTKADTAMVLPIPISLIDKDDIVEFVDLTDSADIFAKIDNLFPSMALWFVMASAKKENYIKVESVGSYEASFVKNSGDFENLDPRFSLDSETLEKLPQYKDYGFIVFKLKATDSKIHPMAFWFKTRETKKLFYPTVHMHDGQIHATEHFDHIFYAQGDVADKPSHYSEGNSFSIVGFRGIPMNANRTLGSQNDTLNEISEKSFSLVGLNLPIQRERLTGESENEDIWWDLK